MKLLIDFQACQAKERSHDVGRYAFGLLKALAQKGKLADSTLHINTTLTGKDDHLLNEILTLSRKTHVVCESYFPMDTQEKDKNRELNSVKFSNIASNYEGVLFFDPMAVSNYNTIFTPSSKISLPRYIWFGAVIHDFIPMVFREYLSTPQTCRDYYRKLQLIRTCDCLLSTSNHTMEDAVNLLEVVPSKTVNISCGFDPLFRNKINSFDDLHSLGIKKDYILYLAENVSHKNITGVINAFALLPDSIKNNLQLVIACWIDNTAEHQLRRLATDVGLSEDSLILTGFVSDEMLTQLYNSASLFVFASLYEGLCFPILEAVHCGIPVLAGNNSSQPEIIGTEDALFNASSPQSIADKIEYALSNPKWLEELKIKQNRHMENFTWEKSAERAWLAIKSSYAAFRKNNVTGYNSLRPKIAWFTPLPPQKSGIANYNASLIPHLMQDFDIDLVIDSGYSVEDDYLNANFNIYSVDEFEARSQLRAYDQCLYQLGNSHFHAYMFPFIQKYGGAVVMHEVYMDGIAEFLEYGSFLSNAYSYAPELTRQKELFHVDFSDHSHRRTVTLLSHILNSADGILVHSRHACDMIQEMLPMHMCPITVSELGVSLPGLLTEHEKIQLRNKLGIEEGKIICSTFGNIQRFKGTEDVIEALCQLQTTIKRNMVFLFVGNCDESQTKWFAGLLSKASLAGLDVRTSGYVNDKLFSDYINISDAALALRTFSRGESSAALLHLMSCGIPSIVYNIGFFSEIDDNAVLKVSLSDTEDLKNKIEQLLTNEKLRKTTSGCARDFVTHFHWPTRAEGYRDLIYKSIEYKERVKKYAEIICSTNKGAVQLLTNDFRY